MSFQNIINEVSKNKDVAMQDDSVRIFSASPLVSGIPGRVTDAARIQSQSIRISSGGDNDYQTGANQNDRAQVPPATLNKVPRIYGSITTGGVIIDAATENNGNTLVFAFALSEVDTDRNDIDVVIGGPDRPFDLDAVYRNDYKCNFLGNDEQVYTLTSQVDGTTVDIPNDLIEVYAWAGNTSSVSQIFPEYGDGNVNRQNAYDLFPGWDSTYEGNGLVIAIVKVTQYQVDGVDFEIKDFGEFTFTLTTNGYDDGVDFLPLNNPSHALKDYLTSSRYGVGLTESDLDLPSFEDWADACDSLTYFKNSAGSILQQKKYEINAFINTQNPVSQNIDLICAAGLGTLTYDNKKGKFRVIANRPMTATEKSNAFEFNSDNIVSSIQVNTTDLYSLFNFATVDFPNTLQRDTTDSILVSISDSEKLSNEPTTGTSIRLLGVNDRSRAADIGNITLKQSRVGTVVTLTGDHSTMVVDVGDFVKVTDEAKGWDSKFFRVIRITESEQNGAVTCSFTLTEYNDRVFEDIIYEDTTNSAFATGVGLGDNYAADSSLSFVDRWLNFTPNPGSATVSDAYLVKNPAVDSVDIINLDTGATTGTTTISGLPASISNIVDLYAQSYIVINTGLNVGGGEPAFNTVTVTFENQTENVANVTAQTEFAPQSENNCTGIILDKLADGNSYKIKIQYANTNVIPYKLSQVYTSAAFTINDDTVNGNAPADTYGPGTTITQDAVSFITGDATVGGTNEVITTPIKHDITDITPGEFTFSGTYTPSWTQPVLSPGIQPDDYIQYSPSGTIVFSNSKDVDTVTVNFNAGGLYANGAVLVGVSSPNGVEQTFNTTVQLDPSFYGLSREWYPSRLNVFMTARHETLYANRIQTATLTDFDYSFVNRTKNYRS